MTTARTWADFADYSEADVYVDCGTTISLGEQYCSSCARKRAYARRRAQDLLDLARDRRVHRLITAWWEATG
jgi:hypothetical protein